MLANALTRAQKLHFWLDKLRDAVLGATRDRRLRGYEGRKLRIETKIEFSGSCDIHSASQRRAELIEALSKNDAVEIDAAQAEYLDLTCVQLLVAASKTAVASRKRLHFGPASPAFHDALARAGVKLSASQDQIIL